MMVKINEFSKICDFLFIFIGLTVFEFSARREGLENLNLKIKLVKLF